MHLFQSGRFTGTSGGELPFKIECDALTRADYDTLAEIVAMQHIFSEVHGVPRGGVPFADSLRPYCSRQGRVLIVDDVLTTGGSMERFRSRLGLRNDQVIGAVIFDRSGGQCPDWIKPIFTLNM